MPKISILWSNSFLRNYDFLDPSTSSHTVRMYGDCHVIARIQAHFTPFKRSHLRPKDRLRATRHWNPYLD